MSAKSTVPVFDFSRDDPSRLLLEGEPEQLFQAVKALPAWTERALEVCDATLTLWASNAHARQRDREGLAAVHLLIRRLQVLRPRENAAVDLNVACYYDRWDGMAALVETRAHMLDRHDPSEIEQRAHMPALKSALGGVRSGESVSTQHLLATLGLSKPRLSQLLALAEAAGLVERTKQGREQSVQAVGIWSKPMSLIPPVDGVRGRSGEMVVPGRFKLAKAA